MIKIFTALFLGVASCALYADKINENDWRFEYPSYGVKYDSGFVRFLGNEDADSFLFYNEANFARLTQGFSATIELPSAMTDAGSVFQAQFMGAGGSSDWIKWNATFYSDLLVILITASDDSSLEKDIPIISQPTSRFNLSFSLTKDSSGTFSTKLSTLDETFDLSSIALSGMSQGEFGIGINGQKFEMDKDNPLLTDFSYAVGTIPEPSTVGAICGVFALLLFIYNKRRS